MPAEIVKEEKKIPKKRNSLIEILDLWIFSMV